MRVKLELHNEILKRIATAEFVSAFEGEVIPQLISVFGESLEGAVMYDHYLDCELLVEGEWYYPLTVISDGAPGTVFVKWGVTDLFRDGVPYAYVGEGEVGFSVCSAPEAIRLEVSGRRISYRSDALPLKVTTALSDPMLLVGKYSQSFLDALAEQIADRLRCALRIEDFSTSTLELDVCFAADTYMEHTSEGVTYRRLLFTDKGCRPRDFWVRWTRADGGVGAVSISDDISPSAVRFELGEDVPQKVREKEFRFLCRANPDKYQSAMGKKMVTEWRELIKRAIKRGELIQLPEPERAPEDDIELRLRSVLGVTDTATTPTAPEVKDDDITAMARAALGESLPEESTSYPTEEPAVDTEDELIFGLDIPEEVEEEGTPDVPEYTEMAENTPDVPEYIEEQEYIEEPKAAQPVETDLEREQRIRREVEAKVRLEYEAEARARAEREREELRAESERLRAENQRLIEEARAREERLEAERREAEERARLERERQEREREELQRQRELERERRLEEEKERERLAEVARAAVEEQRRREIEREERDRLRREELEREERERRERENARRLAEEERRRREKEKEAELVTKHAKLIFRRPVDLNVIKEIKTIVEKTLILENKQTIKIHIKAFPVDSYTINLDMTLPRSEGELLVTLVKAIGNGGVGITKIIVE